MTDDQLYDFSDSIGDTYVFISNQPERPYQPNWRSVYPDRFSPENLRELADELEEYDRKIKVYNQALKENSESNKKILDRFINDALSFLGLSGHNKKDTIVKYCKARVNSPEFTIDYLRDLFWQLVYVREIV